MSLHIENNDSCLSNHSNQDTNNSLSFKYKPPIFMINKVKKLRIWTKEEDELLIKVTEENNYKNWKNVASFFKNRTPLQCLVRYKRIRPGIKKGSWSPDEDRALIHYVQRFGRNWSLISKYMPKRTGKQIRERYVNALDPNLNKDYFSLEEDNRIIDLYLKLGSAWSLISKELPGRTGDMIKNRFNSSLKKRICGFKRAERERERERDVEITGHSQLNAGVAMLTSTSLDNNYNGSNGTSNKNIQNGLNNNNFVLTKRDTNCSSSNGNKFVNNNCASTSSCSPTNFKQIEITQKPFVKQQHDFPNNNNFIYGHGQSNLNNQHNQHEYLVQHQPQLGNKSYQIGHNIVPQNRSPSKSSSNLVNTVGNDPNSININNSNNNNSNSSNSNSNSIHSNPNIITTLNNLFETQKSLINILSTCIQKDPSTLFPQNFMNNSN